MKHRPFRCRIPIDGRRYVRVSFFDTQEEMHAASKEAIGEASHKKEAACTIVNHDPDTRLLAELFFTFRSARPWIIAHEAHHAANDIARALKIGIGEDTEEKVAAFVEKIVKGTMRRLENATLY